ncbi:hypothetical protein GGI04_002348 [Coemansia thaxteri]|uniref:Uncharacterized protein n=1 Tax=Coemansia thaxteri TaxID=2663907 RepID=A0A9W8BFC4_9FUNG|nr:hypothetical protein GGI04_002348 [Coemansia thaxteri]KAJ2005653.1 hypothetical protein H4R26_001841 [Coemansia thaxteri]
MSYSVASLTDSIASSTQTLELDSLQAHHTQALVNIVSSCLYSTPIDATALKRSLVELRRHLESPRSFMYSHPAIETSAVKVIEHIMLCWVCARAAQADAQNYRMESMVKTIDGRFDKYADLPKHIIYEAIQCASYLATMSAGTAAVAKTSLPTSLSLTLGFSDDPVVLTYAFRTLTKLCTKHSVKRAKADGRWESEMGVYAVLDAFTSAQTALGLRNRFDALANAAFTFAADSAAHLTSTPEQARTPILSQHECSSVASDSSSRRSSCQSLSFHHAGSIPSVRPEERALVSALSLVNALISAHDKAEARLRMRRELLDTSLYQCIKLLEEPEFEPTMSSYEARRFRRAYASDIEACDPQISATSITA